MEKMIKLKRWVSIVDAAKYLSGVLEENVTEADVLLYALNGHLNLAVNLVNGAYAKRFQQVNIEDVQYSKLSTLDGKGTIDFPEGGILYQDERGAFQSLPEIYSLDSDVWNLTLHGGARLDVEHRYHLLTGGPAVTLTNIDGNVFVTNLLADDLYQLQQHFEDNEYFPKDKIKIPHNDPENFYPAGSLPEDSVLVVLTGELAKLAALLSQPNQAQDKPLGTTERTTLLTIIAALSKELKLPISQSSKTAGLIADMTDRIGAPVSQRAIEEHLKRIPDTLEKRARS